MLERHKKEYEDRIERVKSIKIYFEDSTLDEVNKLLEAVETYVCDLEKEVRKCQN